MVLSANCLGICNSAKRLDVVNYLQDTKAQIICLQDTHVTEADTEKFKQIWNGTFYLHSHNTNSQGVTVLFNDNFEYTILNTSKDIEGNYLQLLIKMFDVEINLVTIYALNIDNQDFFSKLYNT